MMESFLQESQEEPGSFLFLYLRQRHYCSLELSVEIVIYIVLVIAEMLTGYLDDASEKPWNEYKKGLLDLLVAVVLSLTFMHYNSSTIDLQFQESL